ncbi:MAG: redox-regulated ATPase YchF [Firmicutes bacterium]|nr:redox-regulated ATPase YchF [Bacillota bacterium]
MSLKAGIVGLPNVGKSTLFNAITKKHILAANYPFATIEPNVGVVTVPDTRLDYLVSLYNPKSIVPTTFEFIDIAGLVSGASNGEGLGNKFLSHIREVDAIVEVVRCFDDENITHVEGKTDPIRDIEIINTELILADLEIILNRLGKIEKKAETTKDKEALLEVNVLKKAKESLEKSIPLRLIEFNEDELLILRNFNFITLKSIIYVANVDEVSASTGDNEYSLKLKKYAEEDGASVVVMCAKLESELADLDEEEKKVFLQDVGITNSGLDKLIFATYDLLGLATFFTSGTDECRAWTFRKGMKAPECAGIIHSDFEKGFIKAEIMSFEDLQMSGSELKVKENGKLRLEGKEYLMQDGDICYFRFNV